MEETLKCRGENSTSYIPKEARNNGLCTQHKHRKTAPKVPVTRYKGIFLLDKKRTIEHSVYNRNNDLSQKRIKGIKIYQTIMSIFVCMT